MKELSDESLEAEKIYFEKKATARRALLEEQMTKFIGHPEFDDKELRDDVWFGNQDELTLVRKSSYGVFTIAIAVDGETDINQMSSVCLTDDEIPMLISALQHLLAKDKQ
jgi:hypothetical protein